VRQALTSAREKASASFSSVYRRSQKKYDPVCVLEGSSLLKRPRVLQKHRVQVQEGHSVSVHCQQGRRLAKETAQARQGVGGLREQTVA
jgi:hypothetical protein